MSVIDSIARAWSVDRSVSNLETPADWLVRLAGGAKSASGELVGPSSAMGLSAYYACLRNISEDIAKLPVHALRPRSPRGTERMDSHPVEAMMQTAPNPEMTAIGFRETMTHWAMGWGNGYARIKRNGRGEADSLWPLHPSRCGMVRASDGRLFVEYWNEKGEKERINYEDVFHLHGLASDGLVGYSVAQVGFESIGRALAVQRHSAAFFGNDATIGTVFSHPGKLGDNAAKHLRESLAEISGAGRAYRPYVLEEGMKVDRLSVNPEDAQLIETMTFTVEDIARWFRCPLTKVQHWLRAQGWSTVEASNIDYVIDTLMPWAIRWEQEAKCKLFSARERAGFIKHRFEGLLRGDAAARSEFYTKMFRLGVLNRDEIRELEDRNPVQGGDTYYIESSNLQPIKAESGDGASVEDVNFKREMVKALIADGTIGDVMFNLTDGKALLRQVNVPIAAAAPEEPWLPVVAASGPMVSGDTIKDDEGDVVGGDVIKPETQPDDAGPANEKQDEPETSAATPAVVEQAKAAAIHAFGRVRNKEIKAIKAAMKKHTGESLDTWAADFYARFHEEVGASVGPSLATYLMLTGVEAGFEGMTVASVLEDYMEFTGGLAERLAWLEGNQWILI